MTPENQHVRLEDASEMQGHYDHPQPTGEFFSLLVHLISLCLCKY
jgi:hypothetical protein